MSRRAQVFATDGMSAATTGRSGRARRRLAGAVALLAVVASASAGAFVARGAGTLDTTTSASTSTSSPVRVARSRVRAFFPRLVPVAKSAVKFEHRRAPVPKPPPTTTTTVPATAPPTTAPRVVARVGVPPNAYATSSELCVQAVAQVSWPPGWAVSCEGSRSGLLGLTSRQGTHLYMRTGLSESFIVMVAAHEAGHAWDYARLSASDIATWCAARGCDAAHFFDGPGGPGWSEPGGAEDWAEAWRICHGGSDMRNYLGLGPPSPELCALQLRLVEN